MGSLSLYAATKVKRVVLVPHSNGMGMSPLETLRAVTFGWVYTQVAYLIDYQVSEYPMMTVLAVVGCKKTEEKKHVTDTNRVVRQMRLRGASLPKRPSSIRKCWVFVAKMIG